MSDPPGGTAYLFEFSPPVGKGQDRIGVRLARFETDDEACDHGCGLLKKYPVQAIKVFRVSSNGESVPVRTVPERTDAT